jgi:unsaturated chondroitin disaccharide hydrolase
LSSAEIKNCVIADNNAGNPGSGYYGGASGGSGGGVFFSGSIITIDGCIIKGNTCGSGSDSWSGGDGGDGAGIFSSPSSSLMVSNSEIRGNTTGRGGYGYEVYGGQGGDGAGVFCHSGTISNSVVTSNVTGAGGNSATITNCTIAQNITGSGGSGGNGGSDGLDGEGAGIFADNNSVIANTIVWDNLPDQLAGQDCNNVTYCDIGDGICNGVNGNISINPLFVDPNGPDDDPNTWEDNDYHLSSYSPCIDAGDPVGDYSGQVDIDGEPRVINDRVDIGVDEFLDTDGDSLANYLEILWDLNPDSNDTDGDGLEDGYEICYDKDCNNYNPYPDGNDLDANSLDTDSDEVNDYDEIQWSLNPLNPDTDGEGLTDYYEVNYDEDPTTYNPYPAGGDLNADSTDTDSDGINDYNEIQLGLDPLDPDTDDDGLIDYDEIQWDLNPLKPDTDGDGLQDSNEVCYDEDCNSYDPYDPNTGEGTDLNANSDDTDGDGFSDYDEITHGSSPIDEHSLPQSMTLYVDDDATGANDGSSWTDAFIYLQDALAFAISGDEIQVAQGIYKPDQGVGVTPGDREATFQLINGVVLKGSYAGFGETEPNARDIDIYETILSGDLNGDDGPNFENNGENSYHVFHHPNDTNLNTTAILDGFTITAGNSNGSHPHYYGGGMRNYESSPTVTNCTFAGNSADYFGGGMYNFKSSPRVTDCVFIGNSTVYGGGMYNEQSSPTVTNCTFISNSAKGAYSDGGGMCNFESSSTVTNCTFTGNSAEDGGGMRNINCNPILTNCIFWGNTASSGNNEIYNWNNIYSSTPIISYCDIAGCLPDRLWDTSLGTDGGGNIDADPCFADPNNDFHLKSQAGRWDPCTQNWIQDEVTSLCIDAGDPNSDWTGELWPHGKRINMGAYGGTPEASMSPSSAGNIADLDHDDTVNFADFAVFGNCWPLEQVLLAADLDRNGLMDTNDLNIFCCNWLNAGEEGLVGYWRFDDGSGSIAFDSSCHDNMGILINSPVWTVGKFGGALQFDGNDTAVEIPTDDLDLNAGTISLWAYGNSFYNFKHFLFGHATQPWANRIQLFANASGSLSLGLGDDPYRHQDIMNLVTNQWYQIVLTWDGINYIVYVNGIAKASGTYKGLSNTETYADIGNNGNSSVRIESFNGLIDDVRIYNCVLNPDEIAQLNLDELVSQSLVFAADQLSSTVGVTSLTEYPVRSQSYATWYTTGAAYWGSGFFPGCLWRMYESNNDPNYLAWAEDWTAGLESQAYTFPGHDVGFIIFSSFGNGYRLTNDTAYKDTLLAAAQTLSNLYNPTINAVNLGWGSWECPIAIDTMMNIELLFWGSKNGGQSEWYNMAINHAYKTIEDLLRNNGSTYQIVDYNSSTGEIISKSTLHGYDTESTWSRGQAWALYGFTVSYRETGDPNFLYTAKKVADYYVDNLPSDYVPYWDFDAPGIPNVERDTSAAAIAASGLLELSILVNNFHYRQKYHNAACKTLLSLCTIEPYGGYLAQNANGDHLSPGILMHGCQHHPDAAVPGSVADESLIWGDYYFIEALLRYQSIPAP